MATGSGKRVLIIGGGLVGSLAACCLSRLGYSVQVRERRPDPRMSGYAGGRSINLALSARGLAALRSVGLEELVLERDAIRMPGRMIHTAGTRAEVKQRFQPYSASGHDAINSVSRGGLNVTLLRAASEQAGVTMVFDSPCTDVDLAAPAAMFDRDGGGGGGGGGGRSERVEADLIVCTDGAYSVARGAMMKTDRFEYSQTYLQHGYKELVIPAKDGGGYALEPNALHIWPRGGSMMIALPNRDGSFTCTLFWPYEGDHSFASLRSDGDVTAHFEKHYADAAPLMPTLLADYRMNPIGSLVTVRCWPWQANGKVVLAGDSAHAIVPFYGQGMNAGFEDATALAACLEAHAGNQRAALETYQQQRKENADAIAEMALSNFIEMRDTSGKPAFLYRKRLERAVHRLLGERGTPQYELVSFSTVAYIEAQRRGNEIARMLDGLEMAVPMATGSALDEVAFEAAVKARIGKV